VFFYREQPWFVHASRGRVGAGIPHAASMGMGILHDRVFRLKAMS
jgi:hypothetical protein